MVLVSEFAVVAVVVVIASGSTVGVGVAVSLVLVVQDVESIESVVDISTGVIEYAPVVEVRSTVMVGVTDDDSVDLW